ncbi:hypothetical protein [Sphingobacterium sp. UGAL515B_05]|uniref:hypothetical protein n=1 Tax=Sphingobacterium sp. UGAL515B_05 TaxID=2986767 RepID=UPI002952BE52|nr:hypothetical protein [Sphingobacterium sp. UGAL515B_05]WON94362.1 hypothetical protein OK025_24345 [Sphingobacterium sp. UGAL515B_05]
MMDNPYLKFKNDDLRESKVLAEALNISAIDFLKIQDWFDQLLLYHQELTNDREDQLKAEKELETNFQELISSEIEKDSYKYILPKLLHYNNEFHGAFLRSLYVARLGALLRNNLIPSFVKDKMITYSPEDYFHITVYLKHNYFISPNSNFLEDIIKIEQSRSILKKATMEVKLSTLKNILDIINQKTFHHDVICFKKILKLVTANDTGLMDYLKNYKVENNQCCYKNISDILNFGISADLWKDFEIKVQLIHFFDTSRGAKTTSSWLTKLDELTIRVGSSKLFQLAKAVLKNENCKSHKFDYGVQWSDDTAKRFLKSAQWIKDSLK